MSEHQAIPPAIDQIRAIRHFMDVGGQSVDRMNFKQALFYLGMQLEEIKEQLDELMKASVQSVDPHSEIFQAAQWMHLLSKKLKEGEHLGDIMRADREKFLDGALDSAWVAFACALSYANDTGGAFREVNRANMDKYRNGVIKDANGKVMKPPGWREPDLSPFVDALPTPGDEA